MKKFFLTVMFVSVSFAVFSCKETEKKEQAVVTEQEEVAVEKAAWISGVYKNRAETGGLREIMFCDEGNALVENMIKRTYTSVKENGKHKIILQSNGTFTFYVSEDKKELTPADDFTKEWGTSEIFVIDGSEEVKCN
ncbi:hypothetical protein MQE36_06640 [Zhouia spongiae]|uniref:Copper resistance protein NlpE n=1 Tax=Zhouia spongiae TaxID=2202721 RepID=A0ABY3YQA6_9FLAO|nr:hypothetical protein [Zhouia spongiae]UNZ00020.1 hypothetical protein MQE36_06640 [Zhouia spongiae]